MAVMCKSARQAMILAISDQIDMMLSSKTFNKKGPRIMPRLFVFSAWITQANDQLYGSHNGSPSS